MISGLLFGVKPVDLTTYLGVCILLSIVSSLAAFLPALQAARIQPVP